jgi:hypothetical protein
MPEKEIPDDEARAYESGLAFGKVRAQEWVNSKKATLKAKKIYNTVLLVLGFIFISLLLRVAPVSDTLRNEVFLSWQVISIGCIGFFLLLYSIWSDALISDGASFVDLDERTRYQDFSYTKSTIDMLRRVDSTSAELARLANSTEPQVKRSSGHGFADNMRSIVESLDKQITYAEEKASTLLEVGRGFVRGGIWLYVLSILVWQAYLYYIEFKLSAGVIIGMASTTLIFLIMEFLGAWYLKQYRHYGDSAFSYMKVRSSYNKYMLAFCAVSEYTVDDFPKAQEEMLRVLAEPVSWPDIKDVNSNDFNYMLQSVESMGSVFEKLKGIFARSNNAGGQG